MPRICPFLRGYVCSPRPPSSPCTNSGADGGGYGDFGALYDPSVLINTNGNGFIVVEIQYRLGAFGFLASEEVKSHGQLNAGLLDQRFALQWIQKYIAKFGGDPDRVTVGGESSGAGSVMFHTLAYGGEDDQTLFSNVIAASPYSPPIYEYSDAVSTLYYRAFAELAGCGRNSSQRTQHSSTFECLVAADTEVLQYASGNVSESCGYFGSWTFLPVIDGDFIQDRPSVQLSEGKVSGKRILVGNNANEGVPLTNPDVVSRADYDAFVKSTFPLFTPEDIALLNTVYRVNESAPGDNGTRFDTLGDSGPTALTQSEMATGIQQSVFNMQAETTFACPAQWLAEAFSSEGPSERQAWKYQYSVTPAYHGADLSAYFAVDATVPNTDFRHAFQKIWGSFIIHNSPVISLVDATAGFDNATVPHGPDGQIQWPAYDVDEPWQMDLNTTGGIVTETVVTTKLSYFERTGAGIVNTFRVVNAGSWEDGRGTRCDFWRSLSARVPQ